MYILRILNYRVILIIGKMLSTWNVILMLTTSTNNYSFAATRLSCPATINILQYIKNAYMIDKKHSSPSRRSNWLNNIWTFIFKETCCWYTKHEKERKITLKLKKNQKDSINTTATDTKSSCKKIMQVP